MYLREAILEALENRMRPGHPRRWISRKAWSIKGNELKAGSCLLVTPGPEGCIFFGEFGSQIVNYPLDGADLLADDWYTLSFPLSLNKP